MPVADAKRVIAEVCYKGRIQMLVTSSGRPALVRKPIKDTKDQAMLVR